jgi:hypothetical protein
MCDVVTGRIGLIRVQPYCVLRVHFVAAEVRATGWRRDVWLIWWRMGRIRRLGVWVGLFGVVGMLLD